MKLLPIQPSVQFIKHNTSSQGKSMISFGVSKNTFYRSTHTHTRELLYVYIHANMHVHVYIYNHTHTLLSCLIYYASTHIFFTLEYITFPYIKFHSTTLRDIPFHSTVTIPDKNQTLTISQQQPKIMDDYA